MLLEKMFYVVTMFAICRITEATSNSARRNSLHKTITFATQLHDSDSRAAARIFVQGGSPFPSFTSLPLLPPLRLFSVAIQLGEALYAPPAGQGERTANKHLSGQQICLANKRFLVK